jgi:uncharacterized membrane protein
MERYKHPRYAIALGLIFVFLAFVYWVVPYFGQVVLNEPWELDYAGVVMLGALGIAMALMAYVLMAGTPNQQ